MDDKSAKMMKLAIFEAPSTLVIDETSKNI